MALAAQVGLSPARISQITAASLAATKTTREGAAAGTGETHPAVAATHERSPA